MHNKPFKLRAHIDLHVASKAKGLNFDQSRHIYVYFVCVSIDDTGHYVHMPRLARDRAFIAQ